MKGEGECRSVVRCWEQVSGTLLAGFQTPNKIEAAQTFYIYQFFFIRIYLHIMPGKTEVLAHLVKPQTIQERTIEKRPHEGHPHHTSGSAGPAEASAPVTRYEHNEEEKVIPGYNFQSLFRKKSHIRLARKKNKEEPQKRSLSAKVEGGQKEARNIQKGHWTAQQNKLYHWFLELHSKHFVFKYLRRTDKIFKSMAHFIQTREAEQCRSHHQKMEKKYHSFYQILIKLRMEFYHSHCPESLKQDLELHGYKLKESTLITETELKNGEVGVREEPESNEEESFHNHASSLEGSLNSGSNLLGENYQKGLHFKNIHY